MPPSRSATRRATCWYWRCCGPDRRGGVQAGRSLFSDLALSAAEAGCAMRRSFGRMGGRRPGSYRRCGLRRRGCVRRLAGPALLPLCVRQRHSTGRSHSRRRAAADAAEAAARQVPWRPLAIGCRPGARARGAERANGGGVAHIVGKLAARDWPDCKVLIAAGAGAGTRDRLQCADRRAPSSCSRS